MRRKHLEEGCSLARPESSTPSRRNIVYCSLEIAPGWSWPPWVQDPHMVSLLWRTGVNQCVLALLVHSVLYFIGRRHMAYLCEIDTSPKCEKRSFEAKKMICSFWYSSAICSSRGQSLTIDSRTWRSPSLPTLSPSKSSPFSWWYSGKNPTD